MTALLAGSVELLSKLTADDSQKGAGTDDKVLPLDDRDDKKMTIAGGAARLDRQSASRPGLRSRM